MNTLKKIFIPLLLILFAGFFVNWVSGGKTPPSILSNEEPTQAAQESAPAPSATPSVVEEMPATIIHESPVVEETLRQVSAPERCSKTKLTGDGCVIHLSKHSWSEKICTDGARATSTRFFVNPGMGFVYMKLYRTDDRGESGVETIDDSNDGEDRKTFRRAGIPYPRCIQFLAGASQQVVVKTRSSWSF